MECRHGLVYQDLEGTNEKMLQTFRNYPIFGLLIMGLLIGIFSISGLFTRDLSGGAGAIGSVNGESIQPGEFNRAYQRRVEMMRMYGIKDEQLKNFHLGEGVFQELVNRRLTIELS